MLFSATFMMDAGLGMGYGRSCEVGDVRLCGEDVVKRGLIKLIEGMTLQTSLDNRRMHGDVSTRAKATASTWLDVLDSLQMLTSNMLTKFPFT